MEILNNIVAALVCLVCIVLAVCQLYANHRHVSLVSFSMRQLPMCHLYLAAISSTAFFLDHDAVCILSIDIVFGIFPLLLLASSFLPKNSMVIIVSVIAGVVLNILHVFLVFFSSFSFSTVFYGVCIVLASFVYVIYFGVSLWLYVRRIRNVVQKTTVWTMLVLSVDVVYILVVLVLAVIFYMASSSSGIWVVSVEVLIILLLLLTVVALNYRISADSLFFVMRKHENVILESLNDVPCYISGDRSTPDESYKEIFGRVVDYFESDMPYLSGDLVIEDLVKSVYANKLYISRAISRCTGRNFCQFVNYYRVKHSVEVFRRNPELKVAELAGHCGFNSVVSFTMAFKLYMNENPSDWIRQERNRLSKSRMDRTI